MKVQDAMMGTPIFCSPETNLGSAIELLWGRNCGVLLIVDAMQKVIGVVTDRDLCVALGIETDFQDRSRSETLQLGKSTRPETGRHS